MPLSHPRRFLLHTLAVLLFSLCAWRAGADTATVAVAANSAAAMKDIAAAFEADSGHKIKLSTGSSGKFYAQISNGAPFHAFFSADQSKPAALEANGIAVPGSRFTYAIGALVLWSPDPGVVDAEGEVLKQLRFHKLAIANPLLAPYGAAAVEVLQALGLHEKARSRLVRGESIAQAYQFVATGNAEVGLVARSQVIVDGKVRAGSAWCVPESLHTPIRQDAVLLPAGADSAAAKALLRFVRGDQARSILAAYGYRVETKAPTDPASGP